MARVRLNDVRPGAVLWDDNTSPYEIDVASWDTDVVRTVTFGADEVTVATGRGADHGQPTDEVVVTDPPPRVLMSWAEDAGCWAILIDTTNGSGHSKLNIALNDAELWDGPTDEPEPVPEPRLLSAGMITGGYDYPPCPECGEPRTFTHMATAHEEEP